jgi:hypothetical protein
MLRTGQLLVLCSLTLCASAQTLVRSVPGPLAGALYGKACIEIPDQNSDGIADLLVGAPGFALQCGAVFCLSGAYLKFGTGTLHLWSVAPSSNPGDMFGYAIADMGDATGDGVSEYVIGQPGFDLVGASDVGAIRVLNGSNHSVMSLVVGGISTTNHAAGARFGSAIARCGDSDGDGVSEVIVGAPGSPWSYARILFGADLLTSGSSIAAERFTWSNISSVAMGTAVAGDFDLDHDGLPEVAWSQPGYDFSAGTDNGAFSVYELSPSTISFVGWHVGLSTERFGSSLDVRHDYDGDGVIDFVVGAPNHHDSFGGEAGRVVVVSGASLTPAGVPQHIWQLGGTGGFGFDFHFGAEVCASDDLNGDGVGDILVGAPNYFPITPLNVKGGVSVYSGATGAPLGSITGGSSDVLGDEIVGAVADLDGDGFAELVAAGSLSDAGGSDSGVVKCYRLFPTYATTYCTGKTNSLGCTPSMSSTGTASATSTAAFNVTCANVLNQTSGLLMYSHAPNAAAFQGGTLCVKSPIRRTASQNSGGSASGSDCTGAFSFNFNARIQSGVDPTLVVGSEVFCQYWSRDTASPSTTSLSNALRFVIDP